VLSDETPRRLERAILRVERAQMHQTRVLAGVLVVLLLLVVGYVLR